MILNFLPTVEAASEMAFKSTPEPTVDETITATPASFASPKRKREPVISDYQTRHRDKRVRVISDPGPRSSRRKTTRAAPNGDGSSASQAPVHRLKPRKSRATPKTPIQPKVGRRTIFDGVVLPKFISSSSKGKAKAEVAVHDGEEPQADADPKDDDALEGLEQPRPESSLAGSNKGTLSPSLLSSV